MKRSEIYKRHNFKSFERRKMKRKSSLRIRLVKLTTILASFFLFLLILGSILGLAAFAYFSKDLPSPNKLTAQPRALSTKIYDRQGKLLYDIYGEENRVLVQLEDLPEELIAATLSVEDAEFYKHRGFDVPGIVRAFYQVIFKRKLQGGSTITQQLVKNTLLTPERTLKRKIKEFVLALQIEKKYTKDEILQMYFNEAPYGGQAWGVEAAAETYFGKSVKDLTAAEATLLAGFPQSPSKYLAYPEAAEERRKYVIYLMQTRGWWDKTGQHHTLPKKEAENLIGKSPDVRLISQSIEAPHFVMYVRDILTERYGSKMVEQGGLRVQTSLDLDLQNKFQEIVKEEVEKSANLLVGNGSLAALNPKTGEILAMVGSKDYFDTENDGNVNVTLSLRQPGSAIKPVTYVTAFRKGYTPATMVVDAKTSFDAGAGQPPYVPENYDGKFRGPLQFRYALAQSVNVPAVKVLKIVGIKEMLKMAYDMGLETLEPSEENLGRFGLSLTLGGGEVRLLDLVGAFSIFANKGVRQEPVTILKVEDSQGNVLEEFKLTEGKKILSEEEAFLISDILSDNWARTPVFGSQSPLSLPGYTVAVKTGTTDDKKDNWTIGYTSSIAIGVWTGNNDNSPMHPKLASGITGAAPIWNRAMKLYLKGKEDEPFKRPEGIVEASVDELSGMKPGPFSETRKEIFIKGTVPSQEDNMHMELEVCEEDGRLATEACREAGEVDKKTFIGLRDALPEWQEEVDAWVEAVHGDDEEWHPPKEKSTSYFNPSGTEEPVVKILRPKESSSVDYSFEVEADVITPFTVTKVEFYLDDALYATKTSIPYEQSFNLSKSSTGKHTITVRGYDSAGNAGTGSREVYVGTPPFGAGN